MIETTAFVREVLFPCVRQNRRIDERYCVYRLRIGPSSIHRNGVFAAEHIPAGRKVIEYTGERIGPAEKIRRSIRPIQFIFRLNDDVYIDGGINGSGAEVINHSCGPNLVTRRARGGHIFYFSARDIREGEELTVDYRFSPNSPRNECHCGAPNCRGTINRPEGKARSSTPRSEDNAAYTPPPKTRGRRY